MQQAEGLRLFGGSWARFCAECEESVLEIAIGAQHARKIAHASELRQIIHIQEDTVNDFVICVQTSGSAGNSDHSNQPQQHQSQQQQYTHTSFSPLSAISPSQERLGGKVYTVYSEYVAPQPHQLPTLITHKASVDKVLEISERRKLYPVDPSANMYMMEVITKVRQIPTAAMTAAAAAAGGGGEGGGARPPRDYQCIQWFTNEPHPHATAPGAAHTHAHGHGHDHTHTDTHTNAQTQFDLKAPVTQTHMMNPVHVVDCLHTHFHQQHTHTAEDGHQQQQQHASVHCQFLCEFGVFDGTSFIAPPIDRFSEAVAHSDTTTALLRTLSGGAAAAGGAGGAGGAIAGAKTKSSSRRGSGGVLSAKEAAVEAQQKLQDEIVGMLPKCAHDATLTQWCVSKHGCSHNPTQHHHAHHQHQQQPQYQHQDHYEKVQRRDQQQQQHPLTYTHSFTPTYTPHANTQPGAGAGGTGAAEKFFHGLKQAQLYDFVIPEDMCVFRDFSFVCVEGKTDDLGWEDLPTAHTQAQSGSGRQGNGHARKQTPPPTAPPPTPPTAPTAHTLGQLRRRLWVRILISIPHYDPDAPSTNTSISFRRSQHTNRISFRPSLRPSITGGGGGDNTSVLSGGTSAASTAVTAFTQWQSPTQVFLSSLNSLVLSHLIPSGAAPVTHRGVLWKRGDYFTRWRKRMFVLRDQHLFYYALEGSRPGGPVYKGCFDLSSCVAVLALKPENVFNRLHGIGLVLVQQHLSTGRSSSEDAHAHQAQAQQKIRFLSAESAQAQEKWIQLLSQTLALTHSHTHAHSQTHMGGRFPLSVCPFVSVCVCGAVDPRGCTCVSLCSGELYLQDREKPGEWVLCVCSLTQTQLRYTSHAALNASPRVGSVRNIQAPAQGQQQQQQVIDGVFDVVHSVYTDSPTDVCEFTLQSLVVNVDACVCEGVCVCGWVEQQELLGQEGQHARASTTAVPQTPQRNVLQLSALTHAQKQMWRNAIRMVLAKECVSLSTFADAGVEEEHHTDEDVEAEAEDTARDMLANAHIHEIMSETTDNFAITSASSVVSSQRSDTGDESLSDSGNNSNSDKKKKKSLTRSLTKSFKRASKALLGTSAGAGASASPSLKPTSPPPPPPTHAQVVVSPSPSLVCVDESRNSHVSQNSHSGDRRSFSAVDSLLSPNSLVQAQAQVQAQGQGHTPVSSHAHSSPESRTLMLEQPHQNQDEDGGDGGDQDDDISDVTISTGMRTHTTTPSRSNTYTHTQTLSSIIEEEHHSAAGAGAGHDTDSHTESHSGTHSHADVDAQPHVDTHPPRETIEPMPAPLPAPPQQHAQPQQHHGFVHASSATLSLVPENIRTLLHRQEIFTDKIFQGVWILKKFSNESIYRKRFVWIDPVAKTLNWAKSDNEMTRSKGISVATAVISQKSPLAQTQCFGVTLGEISVRLQLPKPTAKHFAQNSHPPSAGAHRPHVYGEYDPDVDAQVWMKILLILKNN